ncbi:ATP-dependent helicase, partial [Candidatus Pacearchaeota archaeon]|nr:ATP-dependent helicase [Candidatus Pacearchaeota archaeon]
AGSGKTSVLTKRIEFLIKYKGVDPKKILAITFTRKARQEMDTRLKCMGISTNVETFNSFSEKILRKYASLIYNRDIKVINYGNKIMSLMAALNNQGLTIDDAINKYFTPNQKRNKTPEQLSRLFMNDCFFILEYFKSKNLDLYDFSIDSDPEHAATAKMMHKLSLYLKKYMEVSGLRDFTDQIIDTIKFFKENKDFIPEYDYILIDEYQDVNAMQIELLDLINSKNIFAVGDPRQSIFGWRGSSINYILNFQKKYPESIVITLTKNYRSNNHVVDFMNKSIKNMGLPDIKHNFFGEKQIFLENLSTELAEFEYIINRILWSNVGREEIFVLSRTNRQLMDLSKIMKQKGIPHIIKTDEFNGSANASVGQVTLATIHSIKGLEAKTVFVMGCNEQNFPCKASDHPVIEIIKVEDYDKEEEERRLFYVAISRAKQTLYLTYTGKNPTYFINKEMLDMLDT